MSNNNTSEGAGAGCILIIAFIFCGGGIIIVVPILIVIGTLILALRIFLLCGLQLAIAILPSLLLGFIGALILSQVCGQRLLNLKSDPSGLSCSFDRDSHLFTACNFLLLFGNLGLCLWASQHWRPWLSSYPPDPLSLMQGGLISSWLPVLGSSAWWLATILSLSALAFILDKVQSASLASFIARRGKQVQESCMPESLRTRLAELADEAEAAAKDTPWSAPKL